MKHWRLARKRPVLLLQVLLRVGILIIHCLVVANRSLSPSVFSNPSVNIEIITVFSSCSWSESSPLSRAFRFRNSTASSSVGDRLQEFATRRHLRLCTYEFCALDLTLWVGWQTTLRLGCRYIVSLFHISFFLFISFINMPNFLVNHALRRKEEID
jgi:hypothetical protein